MGEGVGALIDGRRGRRVDRWKKETEGGESGEEKLLRDRW